MAATFHTGRFDSRFLGVLILARSRRDMASFHLADPSARLPSGLLDRLPDDAFVSDLSRATVVAHETRHFHDALLYPFGSAVVRERIFAGLHGFGAGVELSRMCDEANTVPVPLQEWLHLPPEDRVAFLKNQSAYLGRELTVAELPVLRADDDLADLETNHGYDVLGAERLLLTSRIALSSYRTLENLWRAPYSPGEKPEASTAVLWEVPGLLTQLAAVHATAGSAAATRYASWVLSQGRRTYLAGLSCVTGIRTITERASVNGRELLALATWAQLGRFESEYRKSAPVVRLMTLSRAVDKGLRWSADDSFTNLIQLWDHTVERDSLADLDASTVALHALTERMSDRAKGAGRAFTVAETALRSYCAAHVRMKQAFLADPDNYVDPLGYVRAQYSYPQPAVAIAYPETLDDGTTREDYVEGTPVDHNPTISFDSAVDLSHLVDLSDALFLSSDRTLQRGGRYLVRECLKMQALRLIM